VSDLSRALWRVEEKYAHGNHLQNPTLHNSAKPAPKHRETETSAQKEMRGKRWLPDMLFASKCLRATARIRVGEISPEYNRKHYPDNKATFSRAALRCVGVGDCRRKSGLTMCPGYQVTLEEEHCTRGPLAFALEARKSQFTKLEAGIFPQPSAWLAASNTPPFSQFPPVKSRSGFSTLQNRHRRRMFLRMAEADQNLFSPTLL